MRPLECERVSGSHTAILRRAGVHTATYAWQGFPPPSRPHVDPMVSSSVSCVFGILRSGSRRQLLLHERSVPLRFVAGLLRSAAVPLLFCHVPPLSRCLPAVVLVLFCRVPPPGLQLFWCCSVVVLLRSASFRRYSVVLLCLSVSFRVLLCPAAGRLIAPFDICLRAGYSVRSITT